ncbi:MAG: CDP-alcohol phosphatidyltransferase family protein [Candidatus Aenigmatarchaeota archaeon]|nr:MAG: CDP-alcohol phosphatidyltransferase family protein [Candidatus Aenigmarchaeota archaeon]
MALYKRRERFSWLSKGIGKSFSKLGLSPNQWTFVTLVPALAAAWLLMNQHFMAAGALLLLAAFIDMVDGAVARATCKVSKTGAYLDTIIDRYIEGIIIFALLFVPIPMLPGVSVPAYAWVFLYFFGGMMTTYAKAAAKEKGLVGKELRGGILERAERLILLVIGITMASYNTLALTFMIAVLAILSNISALQRIWGAVRG